MRPILKMLKISSALDLMGEIQAHLLRHDKYSFLMTPVIPWRPWFKWIQIYTVSWCFITMNWTKVKQDFKTCFKWWDIFTYRYSVASNVLVAFLYLMLTFAFPFNFLSHVHFHVKSTFWQHVWEYVANLCSKKRFLI